jgi:methionyl-tRNA formyltransferase
VVDPSRFRVVFFGTPAFALATLDALLASRHQVVGVVTQADRPRGRGQKTTDVPVKTRALAARVPILQPVALKDQAFLDALTGLDADLGVVAAYGKILPESVIRTPRLGLINVHASRLPRYRGAAPIHRAVIAGEPETGVTIMRIVKALDAGPILAGASRPIQPHETSLDVEHGLAELGASLLVRTVDAMAAGPVEEVPQDDRAATYAPPLRKEEGAIDWSRPATDIHNLIRGLHPWPHAFAVLRGNRLLLLRSSVPGRASQAPAGTVVAAQGDDFEIATGDQVLRLDEVQPEGKRAMSARAFLAGHAVAVGQRFADR